MESKLTLPITTLLAAVLGLWLIMLSMRVVSIRRKQKISIGHGNNDELHRRQRGHANLIEYAPLTIVLFALAEIQNQNIYFLIVLAAMFFIARIVHGCVFSFFKPNLKLRTYSMLATFLCIAALSISNIILVVMSF